MGRHLSTGLRMALITMALFGVVYPLLMTGAARLAFPNQSGGSLVTDGRVLRGSSLIGQQFTGSRYLHPRPSAAGDGYDAQASGGSNLGPTSANLAARVAGDVRLARAGEPGATSIPVDLVTASASGLDPDISPAAAYLQAPRIAHARNMDAAAVRQIIAGHVTGRQFGILGEPRVNVLETNRALDSLEAAPRP